jgi:hypothetical protein
MTAIRAVHNRSGELERFEPAPLPAMREVHVPPFRFTGHVAPTLIALVLMFAAIACIDAITRIPDVAALLAGLLP